MSKAYLNALYEEGTREEIFEWLCKKDAEVDDLRHRYSLRQYDSLSEDQKFHGERVAARKKYNSFE